MIRVILKMQLQYTTPNPNQKLALIKHMRVFDFITENSHLLPLIVKASVLHDSEVQWCYHFKVAICKHVNSVYGTATFLHGLHNLFRSLTRLTPENLSYDEDTRELIKIDVGCRFIKRISILKLILESGHSFFCME